ncbi:hypothetical protein [Halomonas getboli]|uniref:hypothetical protein n=1 Tax=Halomonas getboli TaxID=2935862 RepID=UPI001FFEA7B0|nr:hypothetical protein [Halomonas getboli]MCK2182837.1 hypothetical protein [Halomonas getboli]
MKYLELKVKTAYVVHGFDENNREIREPGQDDFTAKLVAIERIQSISEQYLLVTGSHGRVMYWEYEGGLAQLRERLGAAGLMLP